MHANLHARPRHPARRRHAAHALAALLAAGLLAAPPVEAQTRVVQLAGSKDTTYVLLDDGSVLGWGFHQHGQLGPAPNLSHGPNRAGPTAIALPGRARQIAGGGDSGFALMEDGRLLAWGKGLALGTGGGAAAAAQAAATGVADARRTIDRAQTVANNAERARRGDVGAAVAVLGGLFGGGSRAAASPPAASAPAVQPPADSTAAVVVPLTGIRRIHAHGNLAIALMEDGTLRAWGTRASGRLGDSLANKRWGESSAPALSPVVVPGAERIVQVSIGGSHVLALREDGRILSWGSNRYGQLGRQPVQETVLDTPALVEGIDDAVLVSAGDFPVSMAVRRDGSLWVWGSRNMAQFGNGEADNGRYEWDVHPRIVPGVREPAQVAVGGLNVVARSAAGTLTGWGNTDWGNLGLGQKTGFVYAPRKIPLDQVTEVLVQYNQTYALRRDGSLWYMGVGGDDRWQSASSSNATPIALSLRR